MPVTTKICTFLSLRWKLKSKLIFKKIATIHSLKVLNISLLEFGIGYSTLYFYIKKSHTSLVPKVANISLLDFGIRILDR
jgi:hypothetical protein